MNFAKVNSPIPHYLITSFVLEREHHNLQLKRYYQTLPYQTLSLNPLSWNEKGSALIRL